MTTTRITYRCHDHDGAHTVTATRDGFWSWRVVCPVTDREGFLPIATTKVDDERGTP